MPQQLGEDRASFMARVRGSLEGAHPSDQPLAQSPPEINEAIARNVTRDVDVPALFAQRAQAVGMTVHRVSIDEVVSKVGEILNELDAKRIGLAAGSLEDELNLADAIPGARGEGAAVEIADWKAGPDAGLGPQFDLDAGITDVQGAIAETGTLVCDGDALRSRGLSLVPPVHIALVRESDVLPDLLDYYARLKQTRAADSGEKIDGAALPSAFTMITGPSKTSDIEGMLITGVHGPGRVEILLIRCA